MMHDQYLASHTYIIVDICAETVQVFLRLRRIGSLPQIILKLMMAYKK